MRGTTLVNPDWLDRVAVEEFVADRKVGRALTPAEMAAVARVMLARGDTVNWVCRRLRTRHERLREMLERYPERKAHR